MAPVVSAAVTFRIALGAALADSQGALYVRARRHLLQLAAAPAHIIADDARTAVDPSAVARACRRHAPQPRRRILPACSDGSITPRSGKDASSIAQADGTGITRLPITVATG